MTDVERKRARMKAAADRARASLSEVDRKLASRRPAGPAYVDCEPGGQPQVWGTGIPALSVVALVMAGRSEDDIALLYPQLPPHARKAIASSARRGIAAWLADSE